MDRSPAGESLSVAERLVVAPTVGIFHRLPRYDHLESNDRIRQGDVIGTVLSLGSSSPVQSPFDGLLVSFVAFDGERVRLGQPVAWLRTG